MKMSGIAHRIKISVKGDRKYTMIEKHVKEHYNLDRRKYISTFSLSHGICRMEGSF